MSDLTERAADVLARNNHEHRGLTDAEVYRLLAGAVVAVVADEIARAVEFNLDMDPIPVGIDVPDDYEAGRNAAARIAREIGGRNG